MAISSRLAFCVPVVLLAAACGVPPTAPSDVAPVPAASAAPSTTSEVKPDADRATGGPGSSGSLACRLPAPVKSDDPCKSDADCGPSSPCHATACVAKAKSQTPGPDTICTKSLECDSADANRCGCYEGRCALIPPSP
jgi:hypothetical protein